MNVVALKHNKTSIHFGTKLKKTIGKFFSWFRGLARSSKLIQNDTGVVSPHGPGVDSSDLGAGREADEHSDSNNELQQPLSGDRPEDEESMDSNADDSETTSDTEENDSGEAEFSRDSELEQKDQQSGNEKEDNISHVTDCKKSSVSSSTIKNENERIENEIVNVDIDSKNDKKTETKPKRDSPRKIGARRNRSVPPIDSTQSDKKRTFTPRPELICSKAPGSWQWEVVLYVPTECNIADVRHAGTSLLAEHGKYRLPSYSGSLVVRYKDESEDVLSLYNGKPLIFKMRNNWSGQGRRIDGITRGYFIIIAPSEWTRTGDVPVESTECTDTKFRAHYFTSTHGDTTHSEGGFEECEITLTKSGFRLTGSRVFDDSEEGELFVGSPPNLEPASGVIWARVGEEREDGWGKNFKPADQSLGNVMNGIQGRFFLRVYDDESKLVDSGQFRYCEVLKSVLLNDTPHSPSRLMVPSFNGYSSAKLRFVGKNGTTIRPKLTHQNSLVTVESDGVVTIVPNPRADEVTCSLENEGYSVDIMVKLPRVWWRLDRDNDDSNDLNVWHDTPLIMTREEFFDYAKLGAKILLRLPSRVRSIRVGFEDELDRKYSREKIFDGTILPLEHFVDYSEIDDWLNDDTNFNFNCEESIVSLIQVTADPVPRIVSFTAMPSTITSGDIVTLRWHTENSLPAGAAISPGVGTVEASGSIDVSPTEKTFFTLSLKVPSMEDIDETVTVNIRSQPKLASLLPQRLEKQAFYVRVKRPGGNWRRGKGFSLREIRGAGLSVTDAGVLRIPLDKRRRSVHQTNINLLNEVKLNA